MILSERNEVIDARSWKFDLDGSLNFKLGTRFLVLICSSHLLFYAFPLNKVEIFNIH